MVVLLMERVPASLRGELSRWMIEPKTNVFVGRMSAMVRDKLWETTCKKSKTGAALMIYPARTEQGFAVRTWGETNRQIIDYEGLMLVLIPKSTSQEDKEKKEATISSPEES